MIISKTRAFSVDTAVGPLIATESVVENVTIDDYVRIKTTAAAKKAQLLHMIESADTRLTENRLPVEVDGKRVGGFKV